MTRMMFPILALAATPSFAHEGAAHLHPHGIGLTPMVLGALAVLTAIVVARRF